MPALALLTCSSTFSERAPPMTGGQVGEPVAALGRDRSLPDPSHVRIVIGQSPFATVM